MMLPVAWASVTMSGVAFIVTFDMYVPTSVKTLQFIIGVILILEQRRCALYSFSLTN